MKSLVNPKDPVQMNWIGNRTEWGTVRSVDGISVSKGKKLGENIIKEQYIFENTSGKELLLREGDLAIYTPFQDNYASASVCMQERCHTHVWCGGESSYICALRMSGEGTHLGLCLTKGSLSSYSYERDFSNASNDRGDLILNVTPQVLEPGESIAIEWVIFWHSGKQDFFKKLENFTHYVRVEAERYVLYTGEQIHLRIRSAVPAEEDQIQIERFRKSHDSVSAAAATGQGSVRPFGLRGGIISVDETAELPGEYEYRIQVGEVHTLCRVFVCSPLGELVRKRCHFIVEKQQYHREGSHLNGAYLIYDNEEQHLFYQARSDYNGGRERIGMGILLARYLQSYVDETLAKSLSSYLHYVTHELVNTATGEVYNDAGRDNSCQRLYNAPWAVRFFMEVYRFSGNQEFLKLGMLIMEWFYEQGGARFYAIGVPMSEFIECLEKEGLHQQSLLLLKHFREHAAYLMENGTDYPAHEVNFEQSIVAPAANDLLEMYALTGDDAYLEAAEVQLDILEQFNGRQPDFHLNETSIRHWDGFWFGKKQLYGDTFPHYWSALTGMCYLKYARILERMQEPGMEVGAKQYQRKAYASLRGPLSLFFEDGSASCAYLYPFRVNDRTGQYYDVYANDQDWALYFLLVYEGIV